MSSDKVGDVAEQFREAMRLPLPSARLNPLSGEPERKDLL
jgi:hypothetical protein